MNCGTKVIVTVVGLRVKTTRGRTLARGDPAVGCQEITGTVGETKARNRELLVGRDLGVGIDDLLETRPEAANSRWRASLYGLGLCRRWGDHPSSPSWSLSAGRKLMMRSMRGRTNQEG